MILVGVNLRSELIRCCPTPVNSGSTSLARKHISLEKSLIVITPTLWHWKNISKIRIQFSREIVLDLLVGMFSIHLLRRTRFIFLIISCAHSTSIFRPREILQLSAGFESIIFLKNKILPGIITSSGSNHDTDTSCT